MNEIVSLLPLLLKGFIAFVATNIDDLLLLMLFFWQDDTQIKRGHIIIGQYVGFTIIIVISVLGSLSKFILPLAWLGLLGVIPIFAGIREFSQKRTLDKVNTGSSILTITALTVGNGLDNISTYIPLFASETYLHVYILIVFFLILLAIWYSIGSTLAHISIGRHIGRSMKQLLPFVLIILGVLIMSESGTLSHFFTQK